MTGKRSSKGERHGAAEAAAVATEAAAAAEAAEAVNEESAVTGDSPAAARIAELEAALAEQQRLAAEQARLAGEHLERLQRLAADFDNHKRRVQREKEELALYGAEQFIKTILPVLDNLERALAASGEEQALRSGVELTARQLREALERAGVTPIAAEGQVFDHNLHMAVAVDTESEAAEDTVVAELQKGYRMGERVLRPSMVKVAKK